ncbi:MAG: hypothetical protein EOO92_07560 [Pedobacter sp.]|nr:MAG: hypothetical protein EOO92_07560 [Pedobacter sp.]
MNKLSLLKYGIPSALLGALFSTALSFIFTRDPLQVFIFDFTMLFIGLVIYVSLNSGFPKNELDRFSLSVSNLLLGVCIAMLFFTHTKLYSLVTFSCLFLLLLSIEYLNKLRFMYRFYRAFSLAIVIYFIGLVVFSNTGIEVNPAQTMGLLIAVVPMEKGFFYLLILLISVYLFEFLKSKITRG